MKPTSISNLLSFKSDRNSFHAKELSEQVAGSTGIFVVTNLNTNANVGKIYGDSGVFMPAYTGETLSVSQLKEIIDLCQGIYKVLNVS